MVKTAIILLNLGGPRKLSEVRDFLFNLFYDKTILNFPNPVRWLMAQIISRARNKKACEIYKLLGGKSPILEETIAQANALEDVLDKNKYKVFVCMRHAKPNIDDLEQEIKQYNPDQIIAIPLYPQFSYTTTHSAVEQIKARFKNIKTKFIGCFYTSKQFIDTHVDLIKNALEEVNLNNCIILFSAHSLPIKIIQKGDPYESQVKETVAKIVEKLPLVEHKITYQSKVGPIKWLEPKTEDEILKACLEKKEIVVVAISFVSEHSETLVELDIEYKQIAQEHGIKYVRVQTCRTHPKFIQSLKSLIEISENNHQNITSEAGKRLCDKDFKYCICK